MIHESKCYTATCDNCGANFSEFHSGFSLFVDEAQVHESMDNEEWYARGTDPEHDGKYYCPNCFKHHPEIDDKIIVDESRKKLNSEPTPEGSDTTEADSSNTAGNKITLTEKEIATLQEMDDYLSQTTYVNGEPRYFNAISGSSIFHKQLKAILSRLYQKEESL